MFGKLKEQKLGSKIFGQPVDRQSERIPIVIRHVVEYFQVKGVETEGLFRISGGHSEINRWVDAYEADEVDNLLEVSDPHTCAGLLKHYLRELKEPLCTFELYDCFLAASSVPEEVFIDTLRKVLVLLPRSHRIILKYLIGFLHKVTQQAHVNKMTAENLAIVFAPNLLQPVDRDIYVQLADQGPALHITKGLISQFERVFQDEPDPCAQDSLPPDLHIVGHRVQRSHSLEATHTRTVYLNEPKPPPLEDPELDHEPREQITNQIKQCPPLPELAPVKASSPANKAKLILSLPELKQFQPQSPPPKPPGMEEDEADPIPDSSIEALQPTGTEEKLQQTGLQRLPSWRGAPPPVPQRPTSFRPSTEESGSWAFPPRV